MFTIKKGTTGKLIKLERNKDAEIVDWSTRRNLSFPNVLVSPATVKDITVQGNVPLAIRMARQGYALFGGETGNERDAQYVLAVPYTEIEISNE